MRTLFEGLYRVLYVDGKIKLILFVGNRAHVEALLNDFNLHVSPKVAMNNIEKGYNVCPFSCKCILYSLHVGCTLMSLQAFVPDYFNDSLVSAVIIFLHKTKIFNNIRYNYAETK